MVYVFRAKEDFVFDDNGEFRKYLNFRDNYKVIYFIFLTVYNTFYYGDFKDVKKYNNNI